MQSDDDNDDEDTGGWLAWALIAAVIWAIIIAALYTYRHSHT